MMSYVIPLDEGLDDMDTDWRHDMKDLEIS